MALTFPSFIHDPICLRSSVDGLAIINWYDLLPPPRKLGTRKLLVICAKPPRLGVAPTCTNLPDGARKSADRLYKSAGVPTLSTASWKTWPLAVSASMMLVVL